jgi:hypothetical protein
MENGRTTDRPLGLGTNKLIVMNLKHTSISALLLLSLFLLQESKAFEIEELDEVQAISELADHVASLSGEDCQIMATNIYESKRMELNLRAIQVAALPMESVIVEAPPSDFRRRLAIRILKSDEHWTIPMVAGASGVGSPYQRSLAICDAIISPYYQEGGIDWNGPLSKQRRTEIANGFERFLAEDATGGSPPSSRKDLPAEAGGRNEEGNPLSDHKSSEEGGLSLPVVLIASGAVLMVAVFSILLFRKRARRFGTS